MNKDKLFLHGNLMIAMILCYIIILISEQVESIMVKYLYNTEG